MGFAQEIKDFISTGLAVHKSLRDDDIADARNGYYRAMTTKALRGDPLGDKVKAARAEYLRLRGAQNGAMTSARIGAIDNQNTNRDANTERAAAVAEARRVYLEAKTERDKAIAEGRVGNYNSLIENRGKPKAAKPEKGAIPLVEDPDAENAAAARVGGTPPAAAPAATPAPGPRSALPVPPAMVGEASDDDEPDTDDDDETEVAGYARGGIVQKFAAGGSVEQAPQRMAALPVDGGDYPPAQSFEKTAPAPAAEPEPAEQPDGDSHSKSSTGFDVTEVLKSWGSPPLKGSEPANPVTAGLDEIQRVLHMPVTAALPDAAPAAESPGARLAKNEGAATVAEVKAVDKVVDPTNELTGSARTIARLDMTYKHYLANGEPEKAARIAKSLLLFSKDQAEKFGHVAMVALQNGDKEKAVKYLERAYGQVPDGQSLDAEVGQDGLIHAKVTDHSTGKVTDLGAFSEQQVFKLALGVANGSEYTRRIVDIASQGKKGLSVPKEPKPAKVPGVEKLTDRAKSQEMIGEIKAPEGMDQDKFNKEMGDSLGTIKATAAALLRQNDITPDVATRLVRDLTATGVKPAYTAVDKLPDGGVVLQGADGVQYKVPRPVLTNIAALQGMNAKRDAANKVTADERAKLEQERAAATAPVMARARAERTPQPYISPVGSSPY